MDADFKDSHLRTHVELHVDYGAECVHQLYKGGGGEGKKSYYLSIYIDIMYIMLVYIY